MIKKLFGRSQDSDDLVSACRGEDRDKFAELFGCAQIFCICLPPGMEKGMDLNISKEEFLKKIRADAKAFSQQEESEPFCYARGSLRRLPLFTDQSLVKEFAQAYVRGTKHVTSFQVLGVAGKTAACALGNADVVVLNDSTRYEYELSPEDVRLIRQRWFSQAKHGEGSSLAGPVDDAACRSWSRNRKSSFQYKLGKATLTFTRLDRLIFLLSGLC